MKYRTVHRETSLIMFTFLEIIWDKYLTRLENIKNKSPHGFCSSLHHYNMKTLEGQHHSMRICCTLFSTPNFLPWHLLKGYRKCPSTGLIVSYLSHISFQWSPAGRHRYLERRRSLRWDTGPHTVLHIKHKTQGSTHISAGLHHSNKNCSLKTRGGANACVQYSHVHRKTKILHQ